MKALVCIKRVPLTGGRIVLTADGQALETKHLGFTISPHEECAVEEAVRLVEAHGGESVVLTLGPAEALEQLREAMALGVDRAVHLTTGEGQWDPRAVAAAIVEAIRAEEVGGSFDLVMFGNESPDAGNYQVGIRVAQALGRPCVTGVKAIAVEGSLLRAEQEVPGGRDVFEVALPAVVTVKEGLNLPRFPSVPGKLRAQKKPVAVSAPTAAAPQLEQVLLKLPPGQGKQAEVLGQGAAAAPAVVDVLEQLGVL